MFTIIAAMAELERSVIRERVMAGLEYAREHGTKSGQPIGRPKKIFNREEVMQLRQRGWSVRAIGEHMKIGSGTVMRALKGSSNGSHEPRPSQRVSASVLIMPKPDGENLEQ